MKALFVALLCLTIAVALAGTWWWALFGMTSEVGTAVYVTGLISAVGAFIVGILEWT